jgi:cytochrome c oxidase subunit IV
MPTTTQQKLEAQEDAKMWNILFWICWASYFIASYLDNQLLGWAFIVSYIICLYFEHKAQSHSSTNLLNEYA